MVTANIVSLYSSILHDAGLEALRKRLLRKALDNQENKNVSTDDLTKIAEFVLKKQLL